MMLMMLVMLVMLNHELPVQYSIQYSNNTLSRSSAAAAAAAAADARRAGSRRSAQGLTRRLLHLLVLLTIQSRAS
jgi:hypothetical protein